MQDETGTLQELSLEKTRKAMASLEEKFGGVGAVVVGARLFSNKFVKTGALYEIRGFYDSATKKSTAKQRGKWLPLPLQACRMDCSLKILLQRLDGQEWQCSKFNEKEMLLLSSVNPQPGIVGVSSVALACEAAAVTARHLTAFSEHEKQMWASFLEWASAAITSIKEVVASGVSKSFLALANDESKPYVIRAASKHSVLIWKARYMEAKEANLLR